MDAISRVFERNCDMMAVGLAAIAGGWRTCRSCDAGAKAKPAPDPSHTKTDTERCLRLSAALV